MTHKGEEESSKEAAGAEYLDDCQGLLRTRPRHRVDVTSVRVAEAVQGAPINGLGDDRVHRASGSVTGEYQPVLVRPEAAHSAAPGLDTLKIFEVLQSLEESVLHVLLVTDVALEHFVADLLPVVARAPDVGRREAEVESDDLALGLEGEAGQRPDTSLVTALTRHRIILAVADNSEVQRLEIILLLTFYLDSTRTEK